MQKVIQVWWKFSLAEQATPHNSKAILLQRRAPESLPTQIMLSFYDSLMERYPESHRTVTIHVGDS